MKTLSLSLQDVFKPESNQPGLLFLLLSLIVSTTACSERSRQSAQPGDLFPLSELNQNRNLSQQNPDLANKNLLINFWATWCQPCREEMPFLQQLSGALDNSDYIIIGVSVDDDSNLVKEFLLEYDIKYPNYLDIDRQLANEQLGIMTLPETLLVSPQGIILDRISGQISPRNKKLREFLKLTDVSRRQSQPDISMGRSL